MMQKARSIKMVIVMVIIFEHPWEAITMIWDMGPWTHNPKVEKHKLYYHNTTKREGQKLFVKINNETTNEHL